MSLKSGAPTLARGGSMKTLHRFIIRIHLVFGLSLGLFLLSSPAGLAAPGDPDATFGMGGAVITHAGAFAIAYDVALQADGRIIEVGALADASFARTDFVVVRHNSDGSLDTSFGSGGVVITNFGVSSNAFAGAIQPDGKIVAAGVAGQGLFALARYNPDGS